MTVQVTAARALMPVDPDAADLSLSIVEDLGRRAQVDVDRVVLALRDSASDRSEAVSEPIDLVDAGRALVRESSLDVDLRLPERLLVTDGGATALAVLREALTNAMRHGAGSASVLLQADGQSLRVEVGNPIRAGAEATPSRAGLTGLRERVLLAGGEMKAEPAGGDSWILIATLPIKRATT
jgi:signal transduction histidine kinase